MAYGNFLFSAPVAMELVSSATAAVSTVSGADATSSATGYQAPVGGFALFLDRIEYGILVPMVYFAILFCLAGIVYRIVSIFQAPAQPYSLRIFPSSKKPGLAALSDTFTMPQIRKHKPVFWVFLMVFHISFLLLILGHLDVLPQISIIPEASRHMLGAGLVGVGVTMPLFYFLFRRFASPNREITVPADYILLILIIFLALFGDLMSWGNSWTANGFVMTKADFARYFDGLLRFTFDNPRFVLPGSHYHFVVIHVLLANLFFIILPFSKVVHAFFAMPINLLRRK
ncbi:MAG: respiratory nitrate reductase subunit gamma [Saccharofermentanales bacterium]